MMIQIRFDGPPSEPGRFVEVEDSKGRGVKVGEWVQDDRYWLLKMEVPDETVQGALPTVESLERNAMVIVEEGWPVYHWTDGARKPLCNREMTHPHVLLARRYVTVNLCGSCQDVAAKIAQGW